MAAQDREVQAVFEEGMGDRYSLAFVEDEHVHVGKGLSSTVRVAVDKATGEEVAVKIIDLGDTGRQESDNSRITAEQLREDAHREIELLEFCRNQGQSNVVKLITYYETTTYIFLVFELGKQDLFEYLNDGSCISEKRTRNFMRQLLEVVHFLHSHRIVHRDLKLENLLVMPRPDTDESKDPHQVIKVADFGFAARVPEGENLHQLLGTLTSMAPEVLDISLRNGEGYSFPIDLWACGVIMFTLIETRLPFYSPRTQIIVKKIRNASYNFLHSYWHNVTDEAKDLISKLLVVDPASRFTARQALDHPFFQLDEDRFAS